MKRSGLFHVGIVVPDLESACDHFADLLGLEWGPTIESAFELLDGDGQIVAGDIRVCNSTEPPYIELIEAIPGTIWACNEVSNLHHVAFYADDVAGGSAQLLSMGCPLEISGLEAGAGFVYHLDPLRVRIEYIDLALRPALEAYNYRKSASG
ncbi:MAG TPA: VOC family protein [Acidimicrobiia bacterium]|jgi:catechol 2,3-dioxygenase-like lactoylglutathione lyase family enzyme